MQLFQVGHQFLAAFEELLAIGAQPHMSGGALQQTGSELLFQLLHHGRHTAFGQPELVCGQGETGEFGNAGEHMKRIEVHVLDCIFKVNSAIFFLVFIHDRRTPKVLAC
ncbi:hypothetical protein SDC9_172446 [bioreactor metagenome]|uniref:Uncharacterized protein n=1 Tax=bioreactor metagenome TaxID=1076179 RepID=A0A645GGW5_9ZZZZ